MKFRKAIAADFNIFKELNSEVQQLHAENHPKLFKPASQMNLSEADFATMINEANSIVQIAEVENLPVGYIYYRLINKQENHYGYGHKKLYIDQICVRSTHRRLGVAKALCEFALNKAEEQGIDRIELDVWSFNSEAKSFFAGLGFKTFNERMCLEREHK